MVKVPMEIVVWLSGIRGCTVYLHSAGGSAVETSRDNRSFAAPRGGGCLIFLRTEHGAAQCFVGFHLGEELMPHRAW